MPQFPPNSPLKRATIKDIAQDLQLSPSTVSRALAGDVNLRPETKERIYASADRLGYRRNRLAVSLKKGRTNIIGVIINGLDNPYTLAFLDGIEEYLHSKGINLMVGNSRHDPERERINLRMMEGAVIDGLIISPADIKENETEMMHMKKIGIPIVFVNKVLPGIIASSAVMEAEPTVERCKEMGTISARLVMRKLEHPDLPSEHAKL
ncbi:MAG: LacI family transcriptional regulator [Muribaculaceae bacterium]|nr:LacI family transcriptional regulator [Muribaculaceae bacterium]MDE6795411.1 LacI family transcriptional regulator [Muribaculaceae bacterium]